MSDKLSWIFDMSDVVAVSLLVEETGVHREKDVLQVTDKHYHIMLYWVHPTI
jgi:hypothetical protein